MLQDWSRTEKSDSSPLSLGLVEQVGPAYYAFVHALWLGHLLLVLVVQHHIVEYVKVLTPHLVYTVSNNGRDLVGVSRVPGPAVRHR